MDKQERQALIERYRQGPAELAAAVAAAGPDRLDQLEPGEPGQTRWSPRMIVHHTADSELTAAIRLRRLVAEDNPVIVGYDQELFARALYYDRRPVEPSLAAIAGARESTAAILDQLTEEQWTRAGTHSEMGAYDVEGWLRIYAAHCHDHAAQVRRAVGLE